jgi:hypothetical protein
VRKNVLWRSPSPLFGGFVVVQDGKARDHVEIVLESLCWDSFGVLMGSFWGHLKLYFGLLLVSFCGYFGFS